MKLLVWLGNPWKEYISTRHNAGFLVVDHLVERHEFTTFIVNKKFDAKIAQGRRNKRQTMIIKPQTFMNKSGQSVQKVAQFYQILPEQTLVIHDDIDLPFGTIKLKFSGSDGGHNGIKDIYEKTWSNRFWKLKIGVGRPNHPAHEIVDRVLSKFDQQELNALENIDHEVDLRIEQFMKNSG